MGLLDDAIRQHLELKKRGGAPENEIERLENEAFGAARRAADVPPETDEPVADEPVAEAVPVEEPVAPVSEPPPLPPEPEPEAEAWLEDEPDEVPAEESLEHASQPTSEFTAAEAVEAGGEPVSDYVAPDEEGEDLLEETPDFLQETPEHDRLWFEQKPPRDFDFNE